MVYSQYNWFESVMKFFHDEGVVLRKHDVGEKDEVVILMTKHLGKMAFMAKGSRDPKSRKAGSLQLCNTVAFEARESKSKLDYLQQVKTIRSRGTDLAEKDESLGKFYRAMEILKLTDTFLQELQSVHFVYNDLNLALDLAESPSIVLIYWVRLLQDLGYLPDWSLCCVCHEKLDLETPIEFSTENRGFAHQLLCRNQADKQKLSKAVDKDLVKVMSFWQRSALQEAVRVDVKSEILPRIRDILTAAVIK